MSSAPNSRLNLARKYRPSTLQEVVGQTVAVRTLTEALKLDRISPAYLFSGPRGTGKTTCARIFARAAACLSKEPDKRPCEKCDSCKAQLAGQSSMDLLEIDGASHTGVDDVRQLIESVAYRPNLGARKVYIIDEVHMLSNAAFNALLKTLEEPPPHALFLFATTEPEQIPATILSRVQRIEMRRLKEKEIVKNLERICERENLKAVPESLEQIAAASDGALRDAQTLLEQLFLMSGSSALDSQIVDTFLGTIGIEQEIDILEKIASQNAPEILKKISEFFAQGKDLVRLTSRFLEWTRALLLLKTILSWELLLEDYEEEKLKRLSKAYESWSVDDVDRLFEILWQGHERMRKSELPRITLETTLLRATRIPLTLDLKRILEVLEESPTPVSPRVSTSSARPEAPKVPPMRMGDSAFAPQAPPPPALPTAALTAAELLEEIKKRRPSLHAILVCAEASWKADRFEFVFPKGHFAFRQVSEKILKKEIEELVIELSGKKVREVVLMEASSASSVKAKPVHFMAEAKKKMEQDPQVQKVAQLLGAEIESVTIEGVRSPLKTETTREF